MALELVKVVDGELQVAEEYLNSYALYLKQKAEFEIKEQLFKEQLKKAMEDNNILSYSNDLMTVSYQKPTVRKSLDQKALKEELGDILEPYYRETKVKACLKISMK